MADEATAVMAAAVDAIDGAGGRFDPEHTPGAVAGEPVTAAAAPPAREGDWREYAAGEVRRVAVDRQELADLAAGRADARPLVVFDGRGYFLTRGSEVEIDGPAVLRCSGVPVATVCGNGVRAWVETTAAVRVRVG